MIAVRHKYLDQECMSQQSIPVEEEEAVFSGKQGPKLHTLQQLQAIIAKTAIDNNFE